MMTEQRESMPVWVNVQKDRGTTYEYSIGERPEGASYAGWAQRGIELVGHFKWLENGWAYVPAYVSSPGKPTRIAHFQPDRFWIENHCPEPPRSKWVGLMGHERLSKEPR